MKSFGRLWACLTLVLAAARAFELQLGAAQVAQMGDLQRVILPDTTWLGFLNYITHVHGKTMNQLGFHEMGQGDSEWFNCDFDTLPGIYNCDTMI